MIIGRSLTELGEYAALPRTGRGTPLNPAAREAVWEAYEDYSKRMAKARLTFWPELKRDALTVLRDGRASKSFDAVVADEAPSPGESALGHTHSRRACIASAWYRGARSRQVGA